MHYSGPCYHRNLNSKHTFYLKNILLIQRVVTNGRSGQFPIEIETKLHYVRSKANIEGRTIYYHKNDIL